MTEPEDAAAVWSALLDRNQQLLPLRAAAFRAVRNDLAGLAGAVRATLAAPSQAHAGLQVLMWLEPQLTLELLEDVLTRAKSPRDTGLARQALGRLPRAVLARPLRDAMVARLERSDDDDEYRRYAELLRHLGQTEILRVLVERALASSDRDMRDVGEDFSPDLESG